MVVAKPPSLLDDGAAASGLLVMNRVILKSIKSLTSSNKDAISNKCHASSNRCLTSSNKKLVVETAVHSLELERSYSECWKKTL